jgi:HD-GYP domain-containing protein (c-di-GMP phosphodiesterase class II)
MSQALLISDNEVLNNLYSTNLRIFVDVNVTIKTDLFEAIELLKLNPNFDILICLEKANESESIKELQNHLIQMKKKIPFIVVGSQDDSIKNNFIAISNQFAIRELIRSVAKTLEITAKDMVKKPVPKFFPIPLSIIQEMNVSNCDVYYRVEKDAFEFDYFQILNIDEPIGDKIKTFIQNGIENLYVKAEDRIKFINHSTESILRALNQEDLVIEDRVKVLQESYTFLSEQIYVMEETPKKLQKISEACTASFKKVVQDVPNISKLIEMLLSSKGDYVYSHSIVGAYIGAKIIENMDWGNKEQQEKISFVMFFHDIYLVPILKKYPNITKEEELIYNRDLTTQEKDTVLEHAKLAAQMIRNFSRLPMGADMIMMQHHGMPSGIGFATSFKDDISPISKVILISEDIASFIFECSKQNIQISKQLPQMIEELRQKYRNHTYQKIIDGFCKVKL